MFQIKIITPRYIRNRGGFTMCRRLLVTWPDMVRVYHHGPNGMDWAEFVEG
jgi:hypothetical protein